MDFLTELPTTDGVATLLVVVDRFSKMLRLIPLVGETHAAAVAHAFFDGVVRHHGIPKSIVSDRDPRFLSDFWQGIWKACGTHLKFSTAYHPQTDG